MKTEISKSESLNIINEMIAEARNNFNEESTNTMKFMGYATIAIAVLNIILLYVLESPANSYFIWLLMLPITLLNSFFENKRKKKAIVTTHIDTIVGAVWSAFVICNTLFLVTVFTWAFAYNYWVLTILIMPVILLLVSLALFTTGVAYKFKPYKTGGYIFALGAIACIVSAFSTYYSILQFVVLIICMALGFILPSIQIKKKASKNV